MELDRRHATPYWRDLLGRGLVPMVLVAAGTIGWAAPAHAHTELVDSTPRAGDRVALSTEQVTLSFSDELLAGVGQVAVRGPDGIDLTRGTPRTAENSLVAAIDLEQAGRHTVAYRVVGSDGHAIVGEFAFAVERRPAGGAARPSDPSAAPTPAAAVPGSTSAGPSTSTSDGSVPWPQLTAVVAGLLAVVFVTSRLRSVARPRSRDASEPGEH